MPKNKKRIRLKVASPCEANWDAMTGDEAIRFCGLCKKNVYQISNMSNDQVEELLAEAGEEKCGRFYQRKDGTLVTADCSVGLKRKRRKQAFVGAGVGILSALGVAIGSVGGAASVCESPSISTPTQNPEEFDTIMGGIREFYIEEEEPFEEEEPIQEEEAIEDHRPIMGLMIRMPDPELDELDAATESLEEAIENARERNEEPGQ